MARAWKQVHIGARLTDGAGETREQGDAPREASAGWRRPGGREWAEVLGCCLCRGSDTDESSHPTALDRELRAGRKRRKGRCGNWAEGVHLLQPLTKSPCSSSALSLQGVHPKGRGVKQVKGVFSFSQVFFFFFLIFTSESHDQAGTPR